MKRTNGTKRFQIKFDQNDGRTQQHQKDECDINLIIKRHTPEQIALMATQNEGQYGDATSVDYHAAQNIIANANTMFNDLPSEIRNQFDNDPAAFLDFTSNEENYSEMRKMGIMSPEVITSSSESIVSEANPPQANSVSGNAPQEPSVDRVVDAPKTVTT
jgi:phage internal scaffolding protein